MRSDDKDVRSVLQKYAKKILDLCLYCKGFTHIKFKDQDVDKKFETSWFIKETFEIILVEEIQRGFVARGKLYDKYVKLEQIDEVKCYTLLHELSHAEHYIMEQQCIKYCDDLSKIARKIYDEFYGNVKDKENIYKEILYALTLFDSAEELRTITGLTLMKIGKDYKLVLLPCDNEFILQELDATTLRLTHGEHTFPIREIKHKKFAVELPVSALFYKFLMNKCYGRNVQVKKNYQKTCSDMLAGEMCRVYIETNGNTKKGKERIQNFRNSLYC